MDQSERFGRAQRRWVERERLFKVARRTLKSDFVEPVKCVTAALIEIVPDRTLEYRPRRQIDPNRDLQCAHEPGGDLVLNLEHLVEILVVTAGPQV